jgi:16S rRNA (cytidine1402-2'-O)-methyltransferase
VAAALKAAFEVFGDREAAVCIELTKVHERVSRGFLSELIKEYDNKTVKGEVTIVFAGNNPKFVRPEEEGDEEADE